MFTFYLGFMVQWGDYIATTGAMQPFVLYSLSGLAIAVFFVATIFSEQPEQTKVRWVRYSQQADNAERPTRMRHSDPVEAAINVTNVSDTEH
jgi:succinate dehydrogenase/fumarate reductase cytochrome b subunit